MLLLGTTADTNARLEQVMAPRSETLLHRSESDFELSELQGIEYDQSSAGFRLSKISSGEYLGSGTMVSPVLHTKFWANNLVTS
ncbi:MAG: hypothetical protein QME64_04430, partial [bacterium]|nr:hypothetical protein [bacterium]